MVNEDEMMEVIDQIRFNLPDEIKQANWTVSEQQRIITEAHGEAARIMSRANERAEETASEHEILRRAERHSARRAKVPQPSSNQFTAEPAGERRSHLNNPKRTSARRLRPCRRELEA